MLFLWWKPPQGGFFVTKNWSVYIYLQDLFKLKLEPINFYV